MIVSRKNFILCSIDLVAFFLALALIDLASVICLLFVIVIGCSECKWEIHVIR